jgi:glycosyltransferase involved in cell wall biosynthesis
MCYCCTCAQVNLRAAAARNRGLLESAADWVVFLDDDVMPQQDLLEQYSAAIMQHSSSDAAAAVVSCVGLAQFPEGTSAAVNAVLLSDLTYMFGIARVSTRS